jgi:hypothetical protein
MQNRFAQISVAIAVSVCAPGVAQAGFANLISDGSFQDPPTAAGTYTTFSPGVQIGAWQSQGGEILLVNSSYSAFGITFQAQSGSQSLDLSGGPNPSPNTRVMQTITTEAGKQYELAFYLGSAWTGSGGPFLPPTVLVSAGSASPLSFTNSNLAAGGLMNWERFSFVFNASSASTEIAFQYGNTGPLNYHIGIDTVSVTEVPGPGVLATGLAAAACGARNRRRRRD